MRKKETMSTTHEFEGNIYLRVGDSADSGFIPGSNSSGFQTLEARFFQRCDGCNDSSDSVSELFMGLYAKHPTGGVVRSYINRDHISRGKDCQKIASERFYVRVQKMDARADKDA
jgi:hypothetical protein